MSPERQLYEALVRFAADRGLVLDYDPLAGFVIIPIEGGTLDIPLALLRDTLDLQLQHGVNCPKAPHNGEGWIHDYSHDGPYSVDDSRDSYCGRCHEAL